MKHIFRSVIASLSTPLSLGEGLGVRLFLILLVLTSCRQEDDRTETVAARHWVEKTVAVVAPIGDAATKARLERTADWFL